VHPKNGHKNSPLTRRTPRQRAKRKAAGFSFPTALAIIIISPDFSFENEQSVHKT